ncbi:MAG: BrxA/BrxB family bacilliredoxin [Calditrichia bacterium]
MDNFDINYAPTYDPASVQYMRDELTDVGFRELHSLDEVDQAILREDEDTVLLVINSVCGCAAGGARPGVAYALQHTVIPDHLVSVFAGQDKREVEYIRQRFLHDYVPSSPCVVLFQKGEIRFIMERKDMVNKEAEEIGNMLRQVFDQYCTRRGPSLSPEAYNRLSYTIQCSSNIPRLQNN